MKDKDEIEGLSYMVMDATKMHFKMNFFMHLIKVQSMQ